MGKEVQQLLTDFGGLSFEQIKKKLKEKRDWLTDEQLNGVLVNNAMHVNGIWVLNSLGNPQIDAVRSSLIKVFSSSNPPNTKNKILEAVEADMQRKVALPDFTLRKLLREFAKNENGLWNFKGSKGTEDKNDLSELVCE
ncbi:hypothetical protein ETH_00022765, partial [Eimeria tenella]